MAQGSSGVALILFLNFFPIDVETSTLESLTGYIINQRSVQAPECLH
jgi:hypothetical protein